MLKKLFNSDPSEMDDPVPVHSPDECAPPEAEEITPCQSTDDHDDPVELQGDEETDLPSLVEAAVPGSSASSTEVQAVRELILRSHHNIVPELIAGDNIDALIASVESAKAAYSRIIANVSVPAGGNSPVAFDVEALPTFDKIRRGLMNPGS